MLLSTYGTLLVRDANWGIMVHTRDERAMKPYQ